MIDLSGARPAWPESARLLWQSCARDAARQDRLWSVPAPQGDELLRSELGRLLSLNADQLTITSGVRATAVTYARTERSIALERPTFAGVRQVLAPPGRQLREADWDDLLSADLPRSVTLWLTSPFRNPDGASLTAAQKAALSTRIGDGSTVVINACYAWWDPGWQPVAGADSLGSLHKLAGHGARLGWVYSAHYFERAVPELLGTTPPPVWQHSWGLFLRGGGLDHLVEASGTPSMDAATTFADHLRDHGWLVPPAPHLLLPLAPGLTEQEALHRVSARGFALSPGSAFGATRPALRASFLGVPSRHAAAFAALVASCGVFRTGRE